jgi:hypothetical protein
MPPQTYEAELYETAGTAHAAAFEKMRAAAPYGATPPSFDVFEHGRRTTSGLRAKSAMEYAGEIITKW